jgi:hypothetical protein
LVLLLPPFALNIVRPGAASVSVPFIHHRMCRQPQNVDVPILLLHPRALELINQKGDGNLLVHQKRLLEGGKSGIHNLVEKIEIFIYLIFNLHILLLINFN